jgi:hypothetical protein
MALRKFSFAVTMVPSMLNSITACDLSMAAAIASAPNDAVSLRQPNIFAMLPFALEN